MGERMIDAPAHDFTQETMTHIERVRVLLGEFAKCLEERGKVHDRSKLCAPEKEGFEKSGQALLGLTYGSSAYKSQLERLRPVLAHHYANNSHHPEFYEHRECNLCHRRYPRDFAAHCPECGCGQMALRSGTDGMTLLDLVEMFCDWKAASERHADGSMQASICHNRKRFLIDAQLAQILENSRLEMGWC
jgi:hypothetical protein